MSNVMIGAPAKASGAILTAPLGTTYPTTPFTAFGPAFGERGYVSKDGVTESIDSKESNIVAWGGDTVATVTEEHSVIYKFTFLDTSADVLREVYGDEQVIEHAAAGSDGAFTETRLTSLTPAPKVWAFRVLSKGRVLNVIIPNGQVTKRGDVKYVHTDAIGYEVEVTAYPDAQGVKAYKFSSDAA